MEKWYCLNQFFLSYIIHFKKKNVVNNSTIKRLYWKCIFDEKDKLRVKKCYSNPILLMAKILFLFREQETLNWEQVGVATFFIYFWICHNLFRIAINVSIKCLYKTNCIFCAKVFQKLKPLRQSTKKRKLTIS